jgi:hypothetical protein
MRHRTVIRIEAQYRKLLLKLFHNKIPLYLLTEYPKSGASWLGQLLSDCIPAQFPRQQFPGIGKSIFHGHYLNTNSNGPTIVFWRDPRDIMVSWYYHCLIQTDKNHPGFVTQHRQALGFDDFDAIQDNLPDFISFMFTSPISPRFTFNEFFDSWFGDDKAIHVTYESLTNDPKGTLSSVLDSLEADYSADAIQAVINKYSFKNQTNRSQGDENKSRYLRKGIVGDWKNQFSSNAKKTFLEHTGNRLVQLGYEKDNNWADAN